MKLRYILLSCLMLVASGAVAVPSPSPSNDTTAHSLVAEAEPLTVKVVSGGVDLAVSGEQAMPVAIYAITGQVVKNLTVQPGTVHVDLPAGYYIVQWAKSSQRIVVR